MLGRVCAMGLDGIECRRIWVEADVRPGLPAFTVVGLADKAVREARERVRAAIVNSGFEFPLRRITVNLAPADVAKVGPGFDLPLAMAVLVASGQVPAEATDGVVLAGELSLAGELRAVRGVLAVAEGARRAGLSRLMVPLSRMREASLIDGLVVCGVESLAEGVDVLCGRREPRPCPGATPRPELDPAFAVDLREVRGHNALIPGIEVAAAGGHHLFLHGPPGTGKTMLARRLPTILPPLDCAEAIGVTRIASIAGLRHDDGLVEARPFRAPHHTISASGLVGGGASPMPGEVTLAHHGVLFLDELTEFARPSLEALRQPLEDGQVAIVRGQRLVTFPSRCTLVAAANPCSCAAGGGPCECSAAELARHRRKLSGPLLDRIDVVLGVGRPSAEAMRTQAAPSSAEARERVVAARARQATRFAGLPVSCNAEMTPRMLDELAAIDSAGLREISRLHDRNGLSARGHARVLRVARTIADLDGDVTVGVEHVREAAQLRVEQSAAR